MEKKEEEMNIGLLKSDFFSKACKSVKPKMSFDKELDVVTFLFDDTKQRVIAHYIDFNVAVIYRFSDKEIIGIRIDSFSRDFCPKWSNKTWKINGLIPFNEKLVFSIRIKPQTNKNSETAGIPYLTSINKNEPAEIFC